MVLSWGKSKSTIVRYPYLFLEVLRGWLLLGLRLFYRRIHVLGSHHVPRSGGVLLTSNHNNAVLDALFLSFFSGLRPGFLARADVFRQPWLQRVFTFLQMIPIYRQRDQVDIRTANADTFAATVQWLLAGKSMVIFPEGDKGKDYHLLTLKKGAARIALQAQAADPTADIWIQPTGISFEALHRVHSSVVVQYGEPLLVRPYLESYLTNPEEAVRELTLAVQASLRILCYHKEIHEAPAFQMLVASLPGTYLQRLEAAEKAWVHDADVRKVMMEAAAAYRHRQVPMVDGIPHRQPPVWWWVLSVPAMIGSLLWLLPYRLPQWLSWRLTGHPHFQTSIFFGLLWLLGPILFIVQWSVLLSLLPIMVVAPWLLLSVALIPLDLWWNRWYRRWRVIRQLSVPVWQQWRERIRNISL